MRSTYHPRNERVDKDGVPMTVQEVIYRNMAFEIYLFNGVWFTMDVDYFMGLARALQDGRAFEGKRNRRTMTEEFRHEMYAACDKLLAEYPDLAQRDDLPQPIKEPLALEPMED